MSYSPATVARLFDTGWSNYSGCALPDHLGSKDLFAAVIEAAPSVIDGDIRHKVVATLELQRRSQLEGCLSGNSGKNRTLLRLKGLLSMALYVMLALRRLFMKR